MAFRCGSEISVEEFNRQLPDDRQLHLAGKYKSKMTLAEAKFEYPEWYEKRIVKGEERKTYSRYEGIYHNWKKKIYKYAEVGKRYNCLEALCALAVQCGVEREVVVADCYEMMYHLESLTDDDNNHFTEYDVYCALRTYDNPSETAYYRRLDVISAKTGVPLTPNKRNGLSQKDHLEEARAIRDIRMRRKGVKWDDNNGRKSKKDVVRQWREKNPKGKPKECILETGLNKNTVYKWWDVD